MFTGIIQELATIVSITGNQDFKSLTLAFAPQMMDNLKPGASVAVNGTCLTVTTLEQNNVSFDVLGETLNRTNLDKLTVGDKVNIERSARFGDEIGGHLLSGHIMTTVAITDIQSPTPEQKILTFQNKPALQPYLFTKGYIALNGASLTLVEVTEEFFTVHLIPETLARTTFGAATIGDEINVEIDSQTQVIVDSIQAQLAKKIPQ